METIRLNLRFELEPQAKVKIQTKFDPEGEARSHTFPYLQVEFHLESSSSTSMCRSIVKAKGLTVPTNLDICFARRSHLLSALRLPEVSAKLRRVVALFTLHPPATQPWYSPRITRTRAFASIMLQKSVLDGTEKSPVSSLFRGQKITRWKCIFPAPAGKTYLRQPLCSVRLCVDSGSPKFRARVKFKSKRSRHRLVDINSDSDSASALREGEGHKLSRSQRGKGPETFVFVVVNALPSPSWLPDSQRLGQKRSGTWLWKNSVADAVYAL